MFRKDLALCVVADDLDVDEGPYVELLRSEHRHIGGWWMVLGYCTSYSLFMGCWISPSYFDLTHLFFWEENYTRLNIGLVVFLSLKSELRFYDYFINVLHASQYYSCSIKSNLWRTVSQYMVLYWLKFCKSPWWPEYEFGFDFTAIRDYQKG